MKIVRAKDYKDMSRKAANIISAQIIMKANCVLGLATGSTPIGAYEQLVEWYNKGDLDFSEVTTINLDEYKGISRDNDQSYYYFMNEKLFDRVNINKKNTYLPDGMEPDSEVACRKYNDIIHSIGGVDLQLLGLGHNGHIGFNEPDEFLVPVTHKTKLTESTIEANSRFFASLDEVPRYSLTMGMGSILKARKIIILVSGKEKKEAARRMMEGVLDTRCPASFLSLHPDVTVIATEDAV